MKLLFDEAKKQAFIVRKREYMDFKWPDQITTLSCPEDEAKYLHLIEQLSDEQRDSLQWFWVDMGIYPEPTEKVG